MGQPEYKYIVGDLIDFTADDPKWLEMQEAADFALEMSNLDGERAYGVWLIDDGTCYAIAFDGELFTK